MHVTIHESCTQPYSCIYMVWQARLFKAVEKGEYGMVLLLLKNGVDIHSTMDLAVGRVCVMVMCNGVCVCE